MSSTPDQLTLAAELARAAAFRTALRRFLHRTAEACAVQELTPETYDLLLLVEASPAAGKEWTVAALGDRLALAPPAVAALVRSAEGAGLLERQEVLRDRIYRLRATALGEQRLVAVFRALQSERDRLLITFEQADAQLRALSRSLEPHATAHL